MRVLATRQDQVQGAAQIPSCQKTFCGQEGEGAHPLEEVKGGRAGGGQGRVGPQVQHGHVVHGEWVSHFGGQAEVAQGQQLVLPHPPPVEVHQAQVEGCLCMMLRNDKPSQT